VGDYFKPLIIILKTLHQAVVVISPLCISACLGISMDTFAHEQKKQEKEEAIR